MRRDQNGEDGIYMFTHLGQIKMMIGISGDGPIATHMVPLARFMVRPFRFFWIIKTRK